MRKGEYYTVGLYPASRAFRILYSNRQSAVEGAQKEADRTGKVILVVRVVQVVTPQNTEKVNDGRDFHPTNANDR